MADKVSRKELKQPDALQRVGSEARVWLQERQKAVGIAVIAVLLVGAAAALASYFSDRGESTAAKELGAALKILDKPVVPDAPQGVTEVYRTEAEKDEAIVKSLSEFRQSHSGTQAASTAALTLGQALYRQGKYDEALASLDAFLKDASEEDPLRSVALESQGYAHEAKGQLDQALAAFEKLSKAKTGEFLTGMGQFHKARILIAQNKKDEAAKLLVELQGAHPNTAAARLGQDRLAMLAAEGVKIPEAAPASVDAGS